jgi:hypothetical protein
MRLSFSLHGPSIRDGLTMAIGLVAASLISVAGLSGCMAVPTAIGAGGYPASARPSTAYAFAAPVPVIQPVVETTDAQMTCDQLLAASSSMDQVIATDSAAAHPAPSGGLTDAVMHTAASMAVGALSSFAPGATYLSPATMGLQQQQISQEQLQAQSQAQAMGLQQQQISQEQLQAQSQAQAESQAQMAINNAEQRKMYLATLMRQKKCGENSASGG